MDTRTILFFENVLEWQWTGPERTGTTGWGGTETNLDRRRLEMSEKENNIITMRAASGSVRRVVCRWILALATLAALVFVSAGPSRAQSENATSKSATAETAKPVAEKAPTKGQREGIKVHGWWTIEVRNPDGKVVSHTEFENSLVQPGGAADLTMLLTGTQVVGGYRIDLADTSANLTGPCQPFPNVAVTTCTLFGSLISPTPSTFGDQVSACPGPAGQCFPLSITASTSSFTVSGTAISYAANGKITDVFLMPITCPNFTAPPLPISSVSPSTCAATRGGVVDYLTHATLATPVQIPAAGQSIAVTVQISFQ
jgi:hypothetical protein